MSEILSKRIVVRISAQIINDNPESVSDWIKRKPGAWGFLSGQAIIATRQMLTRNLTQIERRFVWQSLWDSLERLSDRSD